MPVEYSGAALGQVMNRVALSALRERDGRPADLLAPTGIDPGAERSRHELGSETDTEGREVSCHSLLQEPQLVRDERKVHAVVDRQGAAEHDDQIRVLRSDYPHVV